MFSNNPKHGPKIKNQPEIQKLFKVIYIFFRKFEGERTPY